MQFKVVWGEICAIRVKYSFLVCRCQDYLRIIRSTFGVSESCGNNSSRPSHLQLADPEFTVVFRTSEDLRVGKGFQMYVTCFNPEENDAEGSN